MSEDQKKVTRLREALGSTWSHPDVMDSWAFLVTEVSEVGDLLLRLGYGHRADYVRNNPKSSNLKAELGDVYLMLCTLANNLGIDLGKALQERITYLRKRYNGSSEAI